MHPSEKFMWCWYKHRQYYQYSRHVLFLPNWCTNATRYNVTRKTRYYLRSIVHQDRVGQSNQTLPPTTTCPAHLISSESSPSVTDKKYVMQINYTQPRPRPAANLSRPNNVEAQRVRQSRPIRKYDGFRRNADTMKYNVVDLRPVTLFVPHMFKKAPRAPLKSSSKQRKPRESPFTHVKSPLSKVADVPEDMREMHVEDTIGLKQGNAVCLNLVSWKRELYDELKLRTRDLRRKEEKRLMDLLFARVAGSDGRMRPMLTLNDIQPQLAETRPEDGQSKGKEKSKNETRHHGKTKQDGSLDKENEHDKDRKGPTLKFAWNPLVKIKALSPLSKVPEQMVSLSSTHFSAIPLFTANNSLQDTSIDDMIALSLEQSSSPMDCDPPCPSQPVLVQNSKKRKADEMVTYSDPRPSQTPDNDGPPQSKKPRLETKETPELEEWEILEWVKKNPNQKDKDCVLHFRPYLRKLSHEVRRKYVEFIWRATRFPRKIKSREH
ncbi:hypothetical protein K435DRAFT_337941 [Dendrothele bispora CBS 962.96]|uniref:Uncharacterized protein n=1 Tax=Dendrothele bispora (strain CBS 962.96) TaxID=1314807 RepID=A0A4S8MJ84_DENBC|nr:hypothetical protein K435DRAFT_337941 [Dendrothele bispora CBS 962.96]